MTKIKKPYTLVTGGSFGNKALFDAVSEGNLENVVLQHGNVNPQPYAKQHPNWVFIKETPNFHKLIANAELVITGFGVTVTESVMTYARPTVIVINPELTKAATVKDARVLARKVNMPLVEDVSWKNISRAIIDARYNEIPRYESGAPVLADAVLELANWKKPTWIRQLFMPLYLLFALIVAPWVLVGGFLADLAETRHSQ